MDYSRITDDLFIGTTPYAADYEHLRELGVRLVINMRWEYRPRPDVHETPIDFLWLRTFDSPFILIPIKALDRGARAALEAIENGGKVYAHCAKGRHRGVAMGSAILIAQGYEPNEAMKLVTQFRAVADPNIFYIRSRIFRFAQEWNGTVRTGMYSQTEGPP